jgi:hypothetical protein
MKSLPHFIGALIKLNILSANLWQFGQLITWPNFASLRLISLEICSHRLAYVTYVWVKHFYISDATSKKYLFLLNTKGERSSAVFGCKAHEFFLCADTLETEVKGFLENWLFI